MTSHTKPVLQPKTANQGWEPEVGNLGCYTQKQQRHPQVPLSVSEPVASLLGAQYRETFFEAVNTTTYVQHFLLTSVERVAS